jgi:hypothetical protein
MARRGCGLDLILAHGKSYKVGAAFPSSSGGSGAQQAWLKAAGRLPDSSDCDTPTGTWRLRPCGRSVLPRLSCPGRPLWHPSVP